MVDFIKNFIVGLINHKMEQKSVFFVRFLRSPQDKTVLQKWRYPLKNAIKEKQDIFLLLPVVRTILVSDEKIFTIEQHNWNDTVYALRKLR